MNGVHDLGGKEGHGPVVVEADEPVFHHDWERRTHALVIASPTRGNIDAGRHQREKIPGPDYLRMSYYEKWFTALVEMLRASGVVSPDEFATGRADPAAPKGTPRLAADDVAARLTSQGSYLREGPRPAFAPGDRVRAKNLNPLGHTRLPRYARGKEGVVERCHGAHVFPDTHAHGGGDDPRPLYTVVFTAQALWGPDARDGDRVSLDLWEPYLERA